MKSSTVKVNNAPLDNSKIKWIKLNSKPLNQSKSDSGVLLRTVSYTDHDFQHTKMLVDNTITIKIPAIRIRDKFMHNMHFMIDSGFLNTIIRNFSLYFENQGEKRYIQIACDRFFDRYIIGKEKSKLTYSIDKSHLLNRWLKYTPAFEVNVTLPIFYTNTGSEFHSYKYDRYLHHSINYGIDLHDIITLKSDNHDIYILQYISDFVYIPNPILETPTMNTKQIYITHTEKMNFYNSGGIILVSEYYEQMFSELVEINKLYKDIDVTYVDISAIYISMENITTRDLGLKSKYNNGSRCVIKDIILKYEDESSVTLSYTDILHMMTPVYEDFRKDILMINFVEYPKLIMSDILESNLTSIRVTFDFRTILEVYNEDYILYTDRENLSNLNTIIDIEHSIKSDKNTFNQSETDEIQDSFDEVTRKIGTLENMDKFSYFYEENIDIIDDFKMSDVYELTLMSVVRTYTPE